MALRIRCSVWLLLCLLAIPSFPLVADASTAPNKEVAPAAVPIAVEHKNPKLDAGLKQLFATLSLPPVAVSSRRSMKQTPPKLVASLLAAAAQFGASLVNGKLVVKIILKKGVDRNPFAGKLRALGVDVLATANWTTTRVDAAFPAPFLLVVVVGLMPEVRVIHLVWKPAVTSSGTSSPMIAALKAALPQSRGLTGKNVRVCIISDSFNTAGGYSTDVSNGYLPGPGNPAGRTTPVAVLSDQTVGGDEGRALAQIVHAVAPDAQIAFASGTASDAVMAQAINTFINYNCHVILDNIVWTDQNPFQDAPLNALIKAAYDRGIVYLTSAGNFNKMTREMPNPTPVAVTDMPPGILVDTATANADSWPAQQWVKFNDPTVDATATVPEDSYFVPLAALKQRSVLWLFWNDNLYNVHMNYAICIFSSDKTTLLATYTDDTVFSGVNYLAFVADQDYADVFVAVSIVFIDEYNPPMTPLAVSLFALGQGQWFNDTESRAIKGHQGSPYAVTVTAFDASTSTWRSSASKGPYGPVFWDENNNLYDGVSFTPLPDSKPDLGGVDGIALAVANCGAAFNTFTGTSAAVASIAGVSALMLEAARASPVGTLSPAQVKDCLISSTGQASWVASRGFGQVNANDAILRCVPSPTPTVASSPSPTPPFTRTSPTPSPTLLRTASSAPSSTSASPMSRAPSSTVSFTPSSSPWPTPSSTPSSTPFASPTPARAPSLVISPTATASGMPSPSPTSSRTPSPSPTPSSTVSFTASPSASPTPSPTISRTPSPWPTLSPTVSRMPSPSPTPSPTPSRLPSPSPTPAPNLLRMPSPSPSLTPTPSPTSSRTPSQTSSPTPSQSMPSPTRTSSVVSLPSPTPARSVTTGMATATGNNPTPTLAKVPSLTTATTMTMLPTPLKTIAPASGKFINNIINIINSITSIINNNNNDSDDNNNGDQNGNKTSNQSSP